MLKFTELTEKDLAKTALPGRNFLQSVEMYRRYHAQGKEVYILGVVEDSKAAKINAKKSSKTAQKPEILAIMLVVARPWRLGQKMFRAPGGPVALYDSPKIADILKVLLDGAAKFCRARGGMTLEITPNLVLHPRDIDGDVVPDGLIADPSKKARGGMQNPQKADPQLWVTTRARNHENIAKILQKMGYKSLGEQEQTKWQYLLELEKKTPEELLMGMRQPRRQEIKKAAKTGLIIREIEATSDIEPFYQLMLDTAERQHFQAPDLEYFFSIKQFFGEQAKIIVAEGPAEAIQTTASGKVKNIKEGVQTQEKATEPQKTIAKSQQIAKSKQKLVPYAMMLFIAYGDEVVYLYSGANQAYLNSGAVTAVQWQMIQFALEKGYKRYNMYGVKPVKGNGVFRSKQAFGGHVEELLGTFTKPLNLIGHAYLTTKKYQEFGSIH